MSRNKAIGRIALVVLIAMMFTLIAPIVASAETGGGYTGLKQGSDGRYYYYRDGVFQKNYRGLYQHSVNGKYYYLNGGVWRDQYHGFYKHSVNGKSYYIKNGIWQSGYNGLFERAKDGKVYYLKSGVWQSGYTGLYEHSVNGKFYYLKNGIWQGGYTGIYAHSKNGLLYYIKGGIWRKTCDAITSGESDYVVIKGLATKVNTSSDRTLWRAAKVLKSITTDDMSDREKLKKCFDYVKSVPEFRGRTPHYKGIDWPIVYANDIFVGSGDDRTGPKGGNCFSIAAAFAYMAKAIGYKEVYACHDTGHGFVEIDGLVYDPEWSKTHSYSTFFGIPYDTPTDEMQNYPLVLSGSKYNPYMRVKI